MYQPPRNTAVLLQRLQVECRSSLNDLAMSCLLQGLNCPGLLETSWKIHQRNQDIHLSPPCMDSCQGCQSLQIHLHAPWKPVEGNGFLRNKPLSEIVIFEMFIFSLFHVASPQLTFSKDAMAAADGRTLSSQADPSPKLSPNAPRDKIMLQGVLAMACAC